MVSEDLLFEINSPRENLLYADLGESLARPIIYYARFRDGERAYDAIQQTFGNLATTGATWTTNSKEYQIDGNRKTPILNIIHYCVRPNHVSLNEQSA